MKKLLILLFLLNLLTGNSHSIEPDVFVQSTVNRASKLLSENITKEELAQANKQFSDLLKGLGLAGVFALPGGLLAIAFMVKLGEKLGIDIIPEKYKK